MHTKSLFFKDENKKLRENKFQTVRHIYLSLAVIWFLICWVHFLDDRRDIQKLIKSDISGFSSLARHWILWDFFYYLFYFFLLSIAVFFLSPLPLCLTNDCCFEMSSCMLCALSYLVSLAGSLSLSLAMPMLQQCEALQRASLHSLSTPKMEMMLMCRTRPHAASITYMWMYKRNKNYYWRRKIVN